MGAIDDYINSLEGKENLDPLTIARDLQELSTKEIATREAKIQTQEATIAEKDEAISKLDADNVKWKAMNLDLSMQIPGNNQKVERDESVKPDGSNIMPKDLFVPAVQARHFRR